MNLLGGKKLLLIGIVVVLLAAIPLTVFFLQQNQDTRSRAQKATTLYFANSGQLAAQSTTISKAPGESIPVDVIVDPGSNQVSFIKMSISYDATKLSVDQTNGVVQNPNAFPSILEGPTFTDGNISITLSIGADPTKVAQAPTKVATINFTAKETTGSTPTTVKFLDAQTQVLSIASSDQPSENVLATTKPATIAITGSATTTITPSPTSSTNPPTPTPGAGGATTPTAVPTTATAANAAPTCTALTAAPTTSGTVPFTVNFTASGSDTNGTISKATFNFGDGPVQDVTQSGGIGTSTVNVQASHVYNTVGTFQVSVVLTDNAGGVSGSTCTKTIITTAANPGNVTGLPLTGGGANPTAIPTPRPTLPAAGPGDTILKGGIFAAIVAIVGAMAFFAL